MSILHDVERLAGLCGRKCGKGQEQEEVVREQQEAKERIIAAVPQTTDPLELKRVIEFEEATMCMSVPNMFPIYKRLLELEPEPQHVLAFAHFLFIYGPDWDDEATEMVHMAKTGKLAQAVEVALGVEFGK